MSNPVNFFETSNNLRRQFRQIRRNLNKDQQEYAANTVTEAVLKFVPVQKAERIAVFLPFDGEIDTRPLIAQLWKSGKKLSLPVIHPFYHKHLLFINYSPESLLVINRFGIPEPQLNVKDISPLITQDIIIVPLVAFDVTGQRLGMGGGYYDRMLKNWQEKNILPIGLAHDCQQIDYLPSQQWDIPLPVIFTPSKRWEW